MTQDLSNKVVTVFFQSFLYESGEEIQIYKEVSISRSSIADEEMRERIAAFFEKAEDVDESASWGEAVCLTPLQGVPILSYTLDVDGCIYSEHGSPEECKCAVLSGNGMSIHVAIPDDDMEIINALDDALELL